MSSNRYRFCETLKPHFMTCTIVAWLPAFATPKYAKCILDSWTYLIRERDIRIFSWVILENHLHWIAAGPGLGRRVHEFKSFTARKIIDSMQVDGRKTMLQELAYFKQKYKYDQRFQLWQDGSHPQVIETESILEQKTAYIHANPVKRGYVDRPEHWRYSSARDYLGIKGLIDIVTDWR